jgi:heat shock protein HslJ
MDMIRRITYLLLGTTLLFLGACTTQPEELPETGPEGTPGVAAPELPPEAVLAAQQWLVTELNVPVEQVEILEMESEVWPDSCLGSGQPHESCLRADTPGWRAIFDVHGMAYEVRTDLTGSDVRLVPPVGTPDAGNGLENTHWSLVSFGDPEAQRPLVERSDITLLLADGEAGGFGGCNSYGATYQVNGNELTFGEVTQTLRACVDERMNEQEERYFEALQTASHYELEGDNLMITFENGEGLLVFERAVSLDEGAEVTPEG